MKTSTQIIDHVLFIVGGVLITISILYLLFLTAIQQDQIHKHLHKIENLTKRHDSFVCFQMVKASDVDTATLEFKNKFDRCVKLLTEKGE